MARSPIQAGSLVGKSLGKYKILALLAIGGTAEIYLARIAGEAGFEKYVVVKCLLGHLADEKDYVNMFLDEARLCAQLEHSNIVQTLELGEHKRRYFMVMEYLAGMSLAQLARKTAERVRGGLIPIDLVLALAAQAAGGLHYAHEKMSTSGSPLNVVHRDVSPQNLVITFDGILKIVDFGIAKAEARETHTRTGTIKGKFAYMSPEQCQAQPIDRTTDIFALGVIVHELLTGRRLFKRPTSYETYQAITGGKYPAPSQINHRLDPALDEVVMNAVAFEREKRYPDAEAFGEALLSLLHRRGKSVGAADISRYFDEHFSKELDEHGNRMRQLIEGRADTNDEMKWDAGDELPEQDTKKPGRPARVTSPPGRPTEAPDGATKVELNPLERVQNLHASTQDISLPPDTKEQTRPATVPQGKSGTPRVDALMKGTNSGPTQALRPSGMAQIGEERTDPTAPGRKRRAPAVPVGAIKIPSIPPIGARGAGDATKEVGGIKRPGRANDEETREVGKLGEATQDLTRRPHLAAPRLPTAETRDVTAPDPHTAPTREVQRSQLPGALSGTGDDSIDDDSDDATLLNPNKFVPPGGVVTPAPGARVDPLGATAEVSRFPPGAFGGPNPGEASTSEKTRPAMQRPSDGPTAPPLFAQRGAAPGQVAAAPAATNAPTEERLSGPGPHVGPGPGGGPGATPYPGAAFPPGAPPHGMKPAGQDAYGGPPGPGFGGPPHSGPSPYPPGGVPAPLGMPAPPQPGGRVTPGGMQLRTPPGIAAYGQPSGDVHVPTLSSTNRSIWDRANLTLAVVFVVSVGLGLGVTLLLFR